MRDRLSPQTFSTMRGQYGDVHDAPAIRLTIEEQASGWRSFVCEENVVPGVWVSRGVTDLLPAVLHFHELLEERPGKSARGKLHPTIAGDEKEEKSFVLRGCGAHNDAPRLMFRNSPVRGEEERFPGKQ